MAGMNEHLSKPLEMDKVVSVIAKLPNPVNGLEKLLILNQTFTCYILVCFHFYRINMIVVLKQKIYFQD